jgi:hypothetical protein
VDLDVAVQLTHARTHARCQGLQKLTASHTKWLQTSWPAGTCWNPDEKPPERPPPPCHMQLLADELLLRVLSQADTAEVLLRASLTSARMRRLVDGDVNLWRLLCARDWGLPPSGISTEVGSPPRHTIDHFGRCIQIDWHVFRGTDCQLMGVGAERPCRCWVGQPRWWSKPVAAAATDDRTSAGAGPRGGLGPSIRTRGKWRGSYVVSIRARCHVAR